MVNNHNQQIIFRYFFWWPAHSPAGFWWSRHLEIDLELVDKEHPDGEASVGSEVVNMGKKNTKNAVQPTRIWAFNDSIKDGHVVPENRLSLPVETAATRLLELMRDAHDGAAEKCNE